MRDGPVRRAVKAVARAGFVAVLGLRRWGQRRRGEGRWLLDGACGGCARCCEEPSLRVDFLTFFLFRRGFLWWQRAVNGFELVEADRRARTFTFRCAHFDRATRRCDSYDSRPGVCRDYPRELLAQAWPQLLEGCGYRPRARNGEAMLVELKARGLSADTVDELARRLRLR